MAAWKKHRGVLNNSRFLHNLGRFVLLKARFGKKTHCSSHPYTWKFNCCVFWYILGWMSSLREGEYRRRGYGVFLCLIWCLGRSWRTCQSIIFLKLHKDKWQTDSAGKFLNIILNKEHIYLSFLHLKHTVCSYRHRHRIWSTVKLKNVLRMKQTFIYFCGNLH